MTIKEKIKLCIQILFKGRDINKELQIAEEKEKNLCEELSAVSGKKIDKQDIFKRQNIREVIDLVLKK